MNNPLNNLITARFGRDVPDMSQDSLDPIHEQLLKHRSRRRYSDKPVDAALLNRLLACALSAPAKSDLQQVAVINLADSSRRESVTDLIPSMPWIKQAPVFLLFCGDGRRIKRICELRGTAFRHDPIDAFLNSAADAAIVMQNFIVAAEAVGLGCCPISAVRDVTEEISELTSLPEDVFPFVGLCVGYPSDDPAISMRLPMSITVHTDRYVDDDLEASLDEYDTQRALTNPYSKQRDIEAFGEKQNYGWSDDKARQTSHTDRLNFVRYIHEKVLRSGRS